MIVLSKRLQAVASMVTPGKRPADVGCDHGYVPIYLVQSGIAQTVLAMDVNEGPLSRARENIEKYGLSGQINTRLSDGLKNYQRAEANSLIIAGMGGLLIRDILEDAGHRGILEDFDEMILSPHSDGDVVRRALDFWGYTIDREIMLTDGGKYYTVIHSVKAEKAVLARERCPAAGPEDEADYREQDDMYGGYLIRRKDPVLYQYLTQQLNDRMERYDRIRNLDTPGAKAHLPALEAELGRLKSVLKRFEDGHKE